MGDLADFDLGDAAGGGIFDEGPVFLIQAIPGFRQGEERAPLSFVMAVRLQVLPNFVVKSGLAAEGGHPVKEIRLLATTAILGDVGEEFAAHGAPL